MPIRTGKPLRVNVSVEFQVSGSVNVLILDQLESGTEVSGLPVLA